MSAAVDKALTKPELIAQLRDEGSIPVGGGSEKAATYLKAEHALWGGIVRETGAKAD